MFGRKTKEEEVTGRELMCGACVNLVFPKNSLYTDEQLRRLRILGPKMYKTGKAIFTAAPGDRIATQNLMSYMDHLQQELQDIVMPACEPGYIGHDVNW